MERTPQNPEGGELQDALRQEQVPSEMAERWTDDQLILHHIIEALREDRPIDHATARAIAAQLHGGQASPLYALASSGALVEGLTTELDNWRTDETSAIEMEPWLDALDEYVRERDDPNPVEGWSSLWPSPPEAAGELDDEAPARQAVIERINAASVTTLGRLALIEGGTPVDQDDGDEADAYSWGDAARWRPEDDAKRHREHLDELFGRTPDEELGSVEDMGWFGLLKHEGRPGGMVLSRTGYGIRSIREYRTDEELSTAWEGLHEEHSAYQEATRARIHEPGNQENDQAETTSGHNPEIWVGSLSDYNNGRLHGVWLDATLEPDELHQAIQFMLRNGYDHSAEEWAIMDYDDFGGLNLGEYESLEVVSRIAKGIAQHGEAFARWVEYVGENSSEALDRFEDHYLGKFDSAEAYAEYILEETGSYEYLEQIPESLRVYAKFDTEMMGRDMEIELHVVEAGNGGVFVFDPRS